jgi:hypothetical protein
MVSSDNVVIDLTLSPSAATDKAAADDDDDDDDIVVLDPLEVNTLFCAPVSTSNATTSTATLADTDTDIELVGTKNQVLLPHMRQHCTVQSFQGNTGYSTAARRAVNSQYCSHCYCYVCDVPSRECASWDTHCLANDQGVMRHTWKEKRQQHKRKRNTMAARARSTAAAAATATTTTVERLSLAPIVPS